MDAEALLERGKLGTILCLNNPIKPSKNKGIYACDDQNLAERLGCKVECQLFENIYE